MSSAPQYLTLLNPKQLEAVKSIEGPNLVLAGAGTGKTRVLTTRVAYILDQNAAQPSQILCVTFTNKAAREMGERIQSLIPNRFDKMPWMGTFHSLGAKIIRNHAEAIGLKSSFTILDKDDQIALIKQILKSESLDQSQISPKYVQAKIDSWKNKALNPNDINSQHLDSFIDDKVANIYKIYQSRLFNINCLDFGDLLLQCINLFKIEDIHKRYSNNFKFILVDEYQDTNAAQYIWLKMLASHHRNICCVGDDDQSIYSWRGAQADNMLKFEKENPSTKTIKLEQNYRSTNNILKSASSLISHNEMRLGKELYSKQGDGNKINIHLTNSSGDEASLIAKEILKYSKDQPNFDEMAVLVRATFQTREIEESLIKYSVPYRIIGGIRFYERAEIKDSISYLRLVYEKQDDVAFERALLVPKRGIGDKSFGKIISLAKDKSLSLFKAAQALAGSDELPKKAKASLEVFIDLIERCTLMTSSKKFNDILKILLDESGYMEMLKNDKNINALSKIENIKELILAMDDYASIEEFLEHISLVSAVDTTSNDTKVSLMTLHAAKGLEYEFVFLPGWEEGLFPHQRTIDESGTKGIEEERRLAYVGITRAKKILNISTSLTRRFQNNWMPSLQSRFIDELDEDFIKNINHISEHTDPFNNNFDEYNQDDSFVMKKPKFIGSNKYISSNYDKSSSFKTVMEIEAEENVRDINEDIMLSIGQKVEHEKFGIGTVKHVDGTKVHVDFDAHGVKKLISNFLNPC
jgi:DNA helicase-2/ATP-dependent DNA helicase PcrA|tara:strand:+ start:14695 stop:16950 length:2256 start_codon:yes stop_codon:yes gene_type:complete